MLIWQDEFAAVVVVLIIGWLGHVSTNESYNMEYRKYGRIKIIPNTMLPSYHLLPSNKDYNFVTLC